MKEIIDIYARQIIDSRGNPTIEVEVYTNDLIGSAAVPSGASTGIHEAKELRDKEKEYNGLSVSKAVNNVNTIIKDNLLGFDVLEQELIDSTLQALDGTDDKSRLGANAILGVSLASARAGSAVSSMALFEYLSSLANKKPLLPAPFANIINGGKHAGNNLFFQEFMIVPANDNNFLTAIRHVVEFYHALKEVIKKEYGLNAINVGDEGGFAPPINKPEEALDLLMVVRKKLNLEKEIFFAIDAAASEFYIKEKKLYQPEKDLFLDYKELSDYYLKLIKKYPIISLEDPFEQDDFKAWAYFMNLLEKNNISLQVVGDDLLTTNPKRIAEAINKKLCNALLLKVNQIGTLTESIEAANLAFNAGWNVMVSHRSGETEDPFIADLAVGLGCGQIKIGAPCRGERTAKYNQLIRIGEELELINKTEKK